MDNDWTVELPPNKELEIYFENMCDKYGVPPPKPGIDSLFVALHKIRMLVEVLDDLVEIIKGAYQRDKPGPG